MRISVCSSIRSQLILLGVASASVALLCFGYGEYSSRAAALRDTELRKLEVQAAMLGANSVAALRSHDASGSLPASPRVPFRTRAWRARAYTMLMAASWQLITKKNPTLHPPFNPCSNAKTRALVVADGSVGHR